MLKFRGIFLINHRVLYHNTTIYIVLTMRRKRPRLCLSILHRWIMPSSENIEKTAAVDCRHFNQNKTIGDGRITVEFWIIKVHTSNSNWSSNSWGSTNSWGSSNSWVSSNSWDHRIAGDHQNPLDHLSPYLHLKLSSNSTRPTIPIGASWKHPGKILQTSWEHLENI